MTNQDQIAFNGMIDAIIGDLKYAFTQFDLTCVEKEKRKRELITELQTLTVKEDGEG